MPLKRIIFFGVIGAGFLFLSVGIVFAFTGPSSEPGVGSGVIFVDGEGRLGIHTTNPGALLHLGFVASTPPELRMTYDQSSNYFSQKFINGSTFSLGHTGNSMLTILSSGKIGVNTTAPSSTLHVVGATETSGGFIGSGSNITELNLSKSVGSAFSSANYAFPLSLAVGTSTRTNLPATLSVYGTGYFRDRASIGTGSTAGTGLTVGGSTVFLGFTEIQNGAPAYFYSSDNTNNSTISQQGANLSLKNIVYINQSSNVGIGTSTPPYKLSVQGPIYSTGSSTASAFCLGGNCQTSWNALGQWTTTSTGIFYNAGMVGVGTASPGATLQIGQSDASDTNAYGLRIFRKGTLSSPGTYSTTPMIHLLDVSGDGPSSVDVSGHFFLQYPRIADSDTYAENATLFQLANDTGTAIRISGKRNVYIGYYPSTISTQTSSLMINGNVGIGTTNPGAKMTINGADNKDTGPILNIAANSNEQVESGRIRFTETGINGGTYYQGAFLHYNGVANIFNIGVHAPADSATSSDVNAISILRSNGNVGIGTTGPAYKLDVQGNAAFTGLVSGITPVNPPNFTTKSYVDSAISNATSTIIANSLWSGTRNGTIWNGDTGAGNVGIGTTSPTDKLYVSYAGTNYEMAATFRNTATTGNIYNGLKFIQGSTESFHLLTTNAATYLRGISNIPMIFYTNNTERVRISESGNVGIGTPSSIARKLTVNETIGLNDSGGTEKFAISATSGGIDSHMKDAAGTSVVRFDTRSGGLSYINTGNVGIGTTNPQAKLDVNGDNIMFGASGNVQMLTFNNSSGQGQIAWQQSGSRFYLGGGGSQVSGFDFYTNGTSNTPPIRFVAGSSGNATFAGNVGIGTTTPAYKLHVIGAGSFGSNLIHDVATAVADDDAVNYGLLRSSVIAPPPGAQSGFWSVSPDNTKLYPSSTSWNVGIGTTNPTGKLHIADDTQNALKIGSAAVSTIGETDDGVYPGLKINPYNSVLHLGISGGTDNSLYVWDAGTSYMKIQELGSYGVITENSAQPLALQMNGGNVGIGTAGAYHKLTVAGGSLAVENGNIYLLTGKRLYFDYNVSNNYSILKNSTDLEFTTGGTFNFIGDIKQNGSNISSLGAWTNVPTQNDWYTVGYLPTAHGYGEFLIENTQSSQHQVLKFIASILYGNGAQITILQNSTFSVVPFSKIRIARLSSDPTYGPYAVQVYGSDLYGYGNTNRVRINNAGNYGWVLRNFTTAENSSYVGTTAEVDVSLQTMTQSGNLFVKGAGNFNNNLVHGVATAVADDDAVNFGLLKASTGGSGGVGPGTLGQTLRHNGTGWVANSLLYNDGSNIGIGTTDPIYMFDVNAGGNSTVGRIYGSHATLSRFMVENTNASAQTDLNLRNGSGNLYLGVYSSSAYFDNRSGGNLNFQYVGATQMTLTTGGNVGIGVPSPNYKLDVLGSINSGGVGVNGSLYLNNAVDGAGGASLVYNNVNNVLTIGQNRGLASKILLSSNNGIEFQTEDSTSPYNKVTRIIIKHGDTGYVGVGTTTPQAKLDVNGLIKMRSATITQPEDVVNKSYVDSIAGGDVGGIWTRSGNNVYPTSTAYNVGIGTKAPGQKLQVDGGSLLVNTGTSATAYRDIMIGGINGWVSGESHGIDTVYGTAVSPTVFTRIESYFDGTMAKMYFKNFYNGGAQTDTEMTIQGDGNVGIGTTSPSAKLDINGGTGIVADMSGGRIYGVGNAVTSTDALSMGYANGLYAPIPSGQTSSTSGYVLKTGDSMSGTLVMGTLNGNGNLLNMNGNNIVGVNKLTVTTIDPVYTIDGKKYATYVSDSIGIKVHAYGKGKISERGTYSIDFKNAAKGSDEWLFWQTIREGENMNDIMVLLTPEGTNADLWYELKWDAKQIVVHGSKATKFSYQLTAPRHDANEWGNKLLHSEEQGVTLPLK